MSKPNEDKKFTLDLLEAIGGIAGIVTALSVLSTGLGFLSLRANSNMLGIASSIHHSIEEYLMEGGRFLIAIFGTVLVTSIFIFIILLVVFLLIRIRKKEKYPFSVFIQEIDTKFQTKRYLQIVLFLGISVLSLLVFYPNPNTVNQIFDGSLGGMTLIIQPHELQNTSKFVLEVVLLLIVIYLLNLLIRASSSNQTKGKNLLLILYLLLIGYQALLLPINYGIYIHSNDFHQVLDIHLAEGEELEISKNELYLIRKDQKEALLYHNINKKVFLISSEKIHYITLGPRKRFTGKTD